MFICTKKKLVPFFLMTLLIASPSWSQGVRKSLLAGSWYPKDPVALSRLLDHFFKNVPVASLPEGKPLAIIAPHAGYAYSGQVAAYAYTLLQHEDFETVVILSPSHRFGFSGCSIYPKGGYETPLGIAEVDAFLAAEIGKATGFGYIAHAHKAEHAVEIQVPFVQKVLPQAKIVPIVMGRPNKTTVLRLVKGLKTALAGKKAVVIASTDLSHFLSKDEANKTDQSTIALIQEFKTDELIGRCEKGENLMCGGGPVVTALLYGKDMGDVAVLRYADSSQVSQDESQVVGYLAAALMAKSPAREFQLSEQDKKELLQLAYSTVNMYVRENKVPAYTSPNATLSQKCGAFVTLNKGGKLRGCIGFIEPVLPLHQAVIQASIYAASQDARFQPVRSDELDELEVEISVLSPLKRIGNPKIVTPGKHGLLIAKDGKRGLLLPQVAIEHNWTREAFLERTCLKAGLPKNAWRSGAEIYVFEAIVFH
jgi:AmmeMemoRadiSam system protein B/AmmeMemoRadiSam system protein A